MEREIFGHLPKGKSQNIPPASSLPAPCKMPFVSSKVPTPGVVFQTPQPASSKRTPAVAALTNRGTDGYVSDGSDITIDSMLGGGGGRSMNKCSKSARGGPKRSVMKDSNRPGQVTSKARQQPLQQPPLQQSSAAHQTMAAAPQQQVLYQQARAPPQPQAATNTSSRAAILPHQSSAILSGGSPPLLPCEAKSQQGNYEYTKSGGSGSNFSSSPSKPKVKNVFKKLKPIPISSPYRPIINPVV